MFSGRNPMMFHPCGRSPPATPTQYYTQKRFRKGAHFVLGERRGIRRNPYHHYWACRRPLFAEPPIRSSDFAAGSLSRRLECLLEVLKRGGLDKLPAVALVPWAAGVDRVVLALTGRVVEELIDDARSGRDLADRERVFAQTFEGDHERLHVRDFPAHQELKCVLGAGIVTEVEQALVHDLGPGLGRDITTQ